MSELVEQEIKHGRAFYNVAGIACAAGTGILFFHPLEGIGLLLFSGLLLYWSLAGVAIATNRDISAKLTEIIGRLDGMKQVD